MKGAYFPIPHPGKNHMMARDIRLGGYSDSVSVGVGEVCTLEVPGGHRITG